MAGNRNNVWSSFDSRRKAKSDIAGANDLEVEAGSEPDMFAAGGVNAAE